MRLIGGYKAYREAVRESYEINAHNPGVWYSVTYGFEASSTLHPESKTGMVVCKAAYDANSGNPHQTGSRAEYQNARARITAYFTTIQQGGSILSAQDAARDVEL
jgi:hypothetical protein